jgi:hypothetical protein
MYVQFVVSVLLYATQGKRALGKLSDAVEKLLIMKKAFEGVRQLWNWIAEGLNLPIIGG